MPDWALSDLWSAAGSVPLTDPAGSDPVGTEVVVRHAIGLMGTVVGGQWQLDDGRVGGCRIDLPSVNAVIVGRGLSADQESLARRVVGGLSPLLDELAESVERERAAQRAAMTDHLTGLLNRWGWEVAMIAEEARCRRHDKTAVVAVIDLDDLKRVNDTDGHLGGDVLIKMAADALHGACRSEDVIGRIGGDEFGIIAVEQRQGDDAVLQRRIRAVLEDASVAASVGTALRTHTGLKAAFRRADDAMYRDKASRKH